MAPNEEPVLTNQRLRVSSSSNGANFFNIIKVRWHIIGYTTVWRPTWPVHTIPRLAVVYSTDVNKYYHIAEYYRNWLAHYGVHNNMAPNVVIYIF